METKQNEIVLKSAELYLRYGIKSVSMDDIAREMGISKRTLYQSVPDKGELVRMVMNHLLEAARKDLGVFYDRSLSALQQHFTHFLVCGSRYRTTNPAFVFDLRKYYPSFFQEAKEAQKRAVFEANLANLNHGIEQGIFRSDLNPVIISKILEVYYHYIFDPEYQVFTEQELQKTQVYRSIYAYHFRGICSQTGLEELERLWQRYSAEFDALDQQ